MKRFVDDSYDELSKQFKDWSEEKGENYPEFAQAKLIEHYKEFDVKFAIAQGMLEATNS